MSNQKVKNKTKQKKNTPNVSAGIGVDLINNILNCTGLVVSRTEGKSRLGKGNHCLWWHISISAVYNNTPLKLLCTQNPLCGNLIHYALSVQLLEPYIHRRIIVFLNMQTSQSIVDAPWAEMMCKIAFLEACRLGEEVSWNRHITSSTGRLFKWKISIYSAQESSTLNPILPGFLFRLLSWHGAHTLAQTQTHRHTEPKAELWYY